MLFTMSGASQAYLSSFEVSTNVDTTVKNANTIRSA